MRESASVCIGLIEGGGAHTRDEWVRPSSMKEGLAMAVQAVQLSAGMPPPSSAQSAKRRVTNL